MCAQETQDIWTAISLPDKLLAVLVEVSTLTKSHPLLAILLGCIAMCDIVPIFCFLCYLVGTAFALLSIAVFFLCVAVVVGLCMLLPLMGIATFVGVCFGTLGMCAYTAFAFCLQRYQQQRDGKTASKLLNKGT